MSDTVSRSGIVTITPGACPLVRLIDTSLRHDDRRKYHSHEEPEPKRATTYNMTIRGNGGSDKV